MIFCPFLTLKFVGLVSVPKMELVSSIFKVLELLNLKAILYHYVYESCLCHQSSYAIMV